MDQLGVRRFEVYSAWNAFKKLVADCDRGELTSMDDVTIDWAAFHDKADFSSVQFIGHSFGGATLFHILSTPPDEGFSPLPISHALFLDPWLEPFPKPVPGPLDSENEVKTLILHSEEFTLHKSAYLDLMLEMRPLWYNPPAYTIGEYNSLQVPPLSSLINIQSPLPTRQLQRLHISLTQELEKIWHPGYT